MFDMKIKPPSAQKTQGLQVKIKQGGPPMPSQGPQLGADLR